MFLLSGQALPTAVLTCILYGQEKWSNQYSSRRPSMTSTATNSMPIRPTHLKKTFIFYDTLHVCFHSINVLFSPSTSILAVSLQEKIAAFDSCTFTKKFFVTSKKLKHMNFKTVVFLSYYIEFLSANHSS